MASRELAFRGPMEERDFLQTSKTEQIPEGSKSQGKLRLASLALAGGMFVASITGSVSASESLSVMRKGTSQSSSVDAYISRNPWNRGLAREWGAYLKALPHRADLDTQVGTAVMTFWTELTVALAQGPPPPLAGPTDQRSFILVWDHGRHHFEVELFPGGITEWFYRDRETESFEGGEGALEAAVEAARDHFNRVRAT